ncbi:glycosyltransferase family 8 protein [Flagelloscypha sp. PMI_526]|nr:glycosyltransferase family 8 protein [Flagelloscypha sp. PMI_526]
MAGAYAFATLLTSDTYLPGALTLAAALRDLHPRPAQAPEVDFELVCLVTPETVDVSTIKLLRRAFDQVIGVEVIEQKSDAGLRLLGRLDLNTVLTKLHIFRLTQYSKIIFLDADVLPLRPMSHLFTVPHEFSAVPDVGWPDIFNSGVMVLSPGNEKFDELSTLLESKGSWDGGDQGILNEWRGDNWNRLSFTYNTTPTAAYTYAPAYERFGSKISAIHFVGKNKPWKSISERPPFSQSEKSDSNTPPQAYDYGSLLDRWFAVYDKHYRSETIVPDHEFEVKRYASAWDEQTGTGSAAVGSAISSTAVLDLDDLRTMTLSGISATTLIGGAAGGEGEYHSMPLEGRIDLMRPVPQVSVFSKNEDLTPTEIPRRETLPAPPSQTPPAHSSQIPSVHPLQAPSVHPPQVPSAHSSHTPPVNSSQTHPADSSQMSPVHSPQTPEHYEVPPSPHLMPVELPSTPGLMRLPPSEHQQLPPTQPARPPSPPMLIWNPAVNPPPNDPPAPNAFPSDTYFTNVWDQPHSQQYDHHPGPPSSTTLFEPPPPSQIPEMLRRQGHYENVIGRTGEIQDPDKTKVTSVFPWENKPRHMPGRVFPSGDAPSPSAFTSITQTAVPAQHSSPAKESPPPSRTFSPTRGLPASLSFANAWDTVPGIQKYASRLVRPTPPTVPESLEDDSWRHRGSWAAQSEASSADGDVESEEDFSANDQAREDSDHESVTPRRLSRRGSHGSSVPGNGKKEYCSQSAFDMKTSPGNGGRKVHLARSKGQWAPVVSNAALPPLTVSDVSVGVEPSMATALPTPTEPPSQLLSSALEELPTGAKSPRDYSHPTSPVRSPSQFSSGTASRSLQGLATQNVSKVVPMARNASESSTGSSSNDPVSPLDVAPIPTSLSGTRKPGRVFDPARGVDVFKKGSEEVLARFLRMGSWDQQETDIKQGQ